MLKRIPFNANERDLERIEALSAKLGVSKTAVIREALRLLYKKEIDK